MARTRPNGSVSACSLRIFTMMNRKEQITMSHIRLLAAGGALLLALAVPARAADVKIMPVLPQQPKPVKTPPVLPR